MIRSPVRWLLLSRPTLLLLGFVGAAAVAECSLRVLERLALADRRAPLFRADSLLGHRVAPYSGGHDCRGFRNRGCFAQAEIVAIGDSQTWGVNVDAEHAWPQRLGALTGESVYNMGMGSYGVLQYWLLSREALRLRPRVVIHAVYFGNDLYESYRLAYGVDAHRGLRSVGAPGLEDIDSLQQRADSLFREHREFQQRFGRAPGDWPLWLRGHTAVGRALEKAGLLPGTAWYEIGAAWAHEHPDHGAVCDCGRVRTVFTTAYRCLALDPEDPRIREGLRIAKVALRAANDEVSAAGARFLVLFIPTKERAYASLLRRLGSDLSPPHGRLVGFEDYARADIRRFCGEEGMTVVDALPPLERALDAGVATYPPGTESHPNAEGYLVIANAVAERLADSGL